MMTRKLLWSSAIVGLVTSWAPAMAPFSQTQSGSVGSMAVLTYVDTPPAASDATLSLIATGGELNLNGKRLEQLTVDGDTFQTPGQPAGWMLPVNHLDVNLNPVDPVIIPLADLNGFVADGEIVVLVTRPGFLAGGQFDILLEYVSAIPEPATAMLIAGCFSSTLAARRQRL